MILTFVRFWLVKTQWTWTLSTSTFYNPVYSRSMLLTAHLVLVFVSNVFYFFVVEGSVRQGENTFVFVECMSCLIVNSCHCMPYAVCIMVSLDSSFLIYCLMFLKFLKCCQSDLLFLTVVYVILCYVPSFLVFLLPGHVHAGYVFYICYYIIILFLLACMFTFIFSICCKLLDCGSYIMQNVSLEPTPVEFHTKQTLSLSVFCISVIRYENIQQCDVISQNVHLVPSSN